MNIFPIRLKDAEKSPWVVKWMYVMGYLIVIGAAILGAVYGGGLLGPMLDYQLHVDSSVGSILGILLGAAGGILGGLIISFPLWALSTLIDDVHALRVYASGYVTTNENLHDTHI